MILRQTSSIAFPANANVKSSLPMDPQKPFSAACQRNQQPIAEVLADYFPGAFSDSARVLEIGSGSGQHGVFFASRLPHVLWQPTDLAAALAGMELWRQDAGLDNLLPALELDVNRRPWPVSPGFDAVFTANTVHFVDWESVTNLVRGSAEVLPAGGHLLIYGPFNDQGRYTSAGNQQLDQWLRQRDPASGIKDRQALIELAGDAGLGLGRRHCLPANNELLSFCKG